MTCAVLNGRIIGMIDDIHIDDFCRDSALILLYLYRQFPRKAELYVEDIIGPDEQDEYGLHSTRHLSCLSTMIWLAEEGLIRYNQSIRQEALDQVVLTHPTFIKLTSIHKLRGDQNPPISSDISPNLPNSIQAERRTYIALINSALQSGSSYTLRKTLLEILGQLGAPE